MLEKIGILDYSSCTQKIRGCLVLCHGKRMFEDALEEEGDLRVCLKSPFWCLDVALEDALRAVVGCHLQWRRNGGLPFAACLLGALSVFEVFLSIGFGG